jgi:hypothetical protein
MNPMPVQRSPVRLQRELILRRLTTRMGLCVVWGVLGFIGCSGLPPIEEQAQHVRNNELILRQLTPRAFVRAWGKPAYQRSEFMHFFGMKDGSMVPQSRLAVGESPKEWETDFEVGEGVSLIYPDQGWLVVFFENRLVYREALTADKLHSIGRGWKKEEQFRPRMDMPSEPPR